MDQLEKSSQFINFDSQNLDRKSIFQRQAQQIPQQGRLSLKNVSSGGSNDGTLSEQLEVLENAIEKVRPEHKVGVIVGLIRKYIKFNELVQYLCDRLEELPQQEIELFLLQLVYMMIKFRSSIMEKFILNKCSESIGLYLHIKWLYEAFTQTERGDEKQKDKIKTMDQLIEEAMVNRFAVQSSIIQSEDAYIDKLNRSDYANSIDIFMKDLVKLSEERGLFLKKNVIKANRALVSFRENNPNVIYCEGVVLPFPCTKSNLVARIIESECQSFRTKKRVPYKILLETIDMQELKINDPEKQRLDQRPLTETTPKTIIDSFMDQRHQDEAAHKLLIEQSTRRFNLLFPPQRQDNLGLRRTQSCCARIDEPQVSETQSLKQSSLMTLNYEMIKQKINGFRFGHIRKRDLTPETQIKFFRDLMQTYPKHIHPIFKIFKYLKLDQMEVQLEKSSPYEKKSQQTIPMLSFQEDWEYRIGYEKEHSPWGCFQSYQLRPIIVKGGDDLRQELMLMQMLKICRRAFEECGTGAYLRTYEIIVTSHNSGLIEFCTETISIDALKRKFKDKRTLRQIYEQIFPDCFEEAQKCFIDSLAAYSIVQYLFQIKDRHNGNILIDSKGHLIHIDFGFILSISPGGVNFEDVPFKLTKEYVDLMDGKNSDMFCYFTQALFRAYSALRQYIEEFMQIVEVMNYKSDLPCFKKFDPKIFRERFLENATDEDLMIQIAKLVHLSCENKRTTLYDNFQKMTNGIIP